uniref:Uncharacterized protein n=1 Tax=Leersia perrieri TaxID=77586 RepID=A0A0D9VRP0_9ORYZ
MEEEEERKGIKGYERKNGLAIPRPGTRKSATLRPRCYWPAIPVTAAAIPTADTDAHPLDPARACRIPNVLQRGGARERLGAAAVEVDTDGMRECGRHRRSASGSTWRHTREKGTVVDIAGRQRGLAALPCVHPVIFNGDDDGRIRRRWAWGGRICRLRLRGVVVAVAVVRGLSPALLLTVGTREGRGAVVSRGAERGARDLRDNDDTV